MFAAFCLGGIINVTMFTHLLIYISSQFMIIRHQADIGSE